MVNSINWSGSSSLIKSPPQQPPLSGRNAYTTWPGGVDPTVPLYNTDNQKFGGARRRKNTRRNRKNNSRRNRKMYRKNSRKNSRNNRKQNRKSRRAFRRHRGGFATCSPVFSGASFPMTSSVCPEGYFEDKGLIA
jgi:hypothetical protein